MNPLPWVAPAGTTALIFDCDGTLADTMPIHFKAWTAMLGRHGIPFPEARFYELGGVPTAKIIRLLAAEHGIPLGDVEAMVVEKEDLFLTMIDQIQPVQAVYDIGRDHRHVYPMAVASGVNWACGRDNRPVGSRIRKPLACTGPAMASGSMRRVARFMIGVEKPKHREARIAAAVPSNTSVVGSTGPRRTTRPTPQRPTTPPNSLRRVSVSSFIQADARVPKTTAVVLSSAT